MELSSIVQPKDCTRDWLKKDSRIQEMAQIVTQKAGPEGKYTPELEWKAWRAGISDKKINLPGG